MYHKDEMIILTIKHRQTDITMTERKNKNYKENTEQMDKILDALKERAKELNCLFQVEELLKDYNAELADIFLGIVKAIPTACRFPDRCRVRIEYMNKFYGDEVVIDPFALEKVDFRVQDTITGAIYVAYVDSDYDDDSEFFLPEEGKLFKTIAQRLSDHIQHRLLRNALYGSDKKSIKTPAVSSKYKIVTEMCRSMDPRLFVRIARKMLNYLCYKGIKEATRLFHQIGTEQGAAKNNAESLGENLPQRKKDDSEMLTLCYEIFEVANRHLPDDEILNLIQKWMQEDRASFLIKTLETLDSSLGEISDALRRYLRLSAEGVALSEPVLKGVRVALIRRFISEQLEYIRIAKNFIRIKDFVNLIDRLIYPRGSHGRLGGKSAGMFLAHQILRRRSRQFKELVGIKVPKTWYITSDGLHNFMDYNNLEEVTEQKYKDVDQVRREYQHIIQLFKNSRFPPEMLHELTTALDDFGDVPIIVRSSSLLEDRFGSSFSGKYKSLFLANQGSKEERLDALTDAIAEVYASTYGSDPIEYRAERDLIDFYEEMGVIIQEVVGTKVGRYFLPSFAGVAFSTNEFRWTPRIRREDGLIRMVPGLGTRAVDRLSDDYPVLIAPGQPGLRVNVSMEEILRYSPKYMDVINLETNTFETIDIEEFIHEFGEDLPAVENILSVIKDNHIQKFNLFAVDFHKDEFVVNFEGLLRSSDFIGRIHTILRVLEDALGTPVDIEFASDGTDLYILQCRPQSYTTELTPPNLPKDLPPNAVLFTANRYISNGMVNGISHIVYIDPEEYSSLSSLSELVSVGRAVSRLNKTLPKRRFILMGPGRWGSRGDIKLGVQVTYSDINNTALLVEIARKKGNYVPDLSFGTHFFQDLVEAAIRYLPLYPDDEGIIFNDRFFKESQNKLTEFAPEFSPLTNVVKVIDIGSETNGKVVNVFMNAVVEQAIAVLSQSTEKMSLEKIKPIYQRGQLLEEHWHWRYRMVESLAENIDYERYGVNAIYLFGSVKNRTANADSDIDLLVNFNGDDQTRKTLLEWLDGWSRCLAEVNYHRTGFRTNGLLDVHIVTDEEMNQDNWMTRYDMENDSLLEIALPNRKGSRDKKES